MVSLHRLESFFHEIKCNGMTSLVEFMTQITCVNQVEVLYPIIDNLVGILTDSLKCLMMFLSGLAR